MNEVIEVYEKSTVRTPESDDIALLMISRNGIEFPLADIYWTNPNRFKEMIKELNLVFKKYGLGKHKR